MTSSQVRASCSPHVTLCHLESQWVDFGERSTLLGLFSANGRIPSWPLSSCDLARIGVQESEPRVDGLLSDFNGCAPPWVLAAGSPTSTSLIPSNPAVYARLPMVHRDESRTHGLDDRAASRGGGFAGGRRGGASPVTSAVQRPPPSPSRTDAEAAMRTNGRIALLDAHCPDINSHVFTQWKPAARRG